MKPRLSVISFLVVTLLTGISASAVGQVNGPIDVGNRLEPFVDDYMIDSISGEAELRLHTPINREVAITHDQPWEGNTCTYHTVFKDDGLYRMYYRASHNIEDGTGKTKAHPAYTCYAESTDGIHWTKPNLGLYEFNGSKDNNIVYIDGFGNFAPFKDANPRAKPDEKYKAVAGYKVGGLYAYKSPDGIHWEKMHDDLVITDGAFDSLNLAFFDTVRGCYVAFFRDFRDGKRDVKTCTSDDCLHWTEPVWLEYPGAPRQHLYTNGIRPYARAPHILIGLAKRYISNRNPSGHPAKGVSDAVLMTSRDGRNFHRWSEAIIRPGLQKSRWINRNNLPAWGLVETPSDVPGTPNELSFYTTEDYYVGDAAKLRRHTWRLDGFASIHAPYVGGEAVTKPLVFAHPGGMEQRAAADDRQAATTDDDAASADKNTEIRLLLNVSTSAAGRVLVELQDENGRPIPGHALSDCDEILGDAIEWPVSWNGNGDLSALAGRAVRVRFKLKDADVYALRFRAE